MSVTSAQAAAGAPGMDDIFGGLSLTGGGVSASPAPPAQPTVAAPVDDIFAGLTTPAADVPPSPAGPTQTPMVMGNAKASAFDVFDDIADAPVPRLSASQPSGFDFMSPEERASLDAGRRSSLDGSGGPSFLDFLNAQQAPPSPQSPPAQAQSAVGGGMQQYASPSYGQQPLYAQPPQQLHMQYPQPPPGGGAYHPSHGYQHQPHQHMYGHHQHQHQHHAAQHQVSAVF